MKTFRGEVILLRDSRKALIADMEAVSDFLERRNQMREHAGTDAIAQAEQILREAA